MNENTSTPAEIAAKFINHTHRNVFLTGKAGTGKTTFLRQIVSKTYKNTVIAAPTGIAAINAGGITLHSLFQLPFGAFVPDEKAQFQEHMKLNTPKDLFRNLQLGGNKRKLLQELELLIIDEVSMLRADLLDAIDTVLRGVRKRKSQPFGGVQVLFIGDLLQLPPVVREEEWRHLKNYYRSAFFFDAKVLQEEKPLYIELDKIHRQSDNTFISLLNNLRNNQVTPKDIELLNAHYKPDFVPEKGENYIHLTTHNHKADALNREALAKLKNKSYSYSAIVKGDFNEKSFPMDATLELKTGAQVMFIKNDPSGQKKFFNGKIGTVSKLEKDKIEVEFTDGTFVEVDKYEWKNIKYKLDTVTNEVEEEVQGTFLHYPVKLAWAITVHKSQGLTFEKAMIDIGDAFAPGQVYVALSRLTSLDGLVMTTRIQTGSLKVDENISAYSENKPEKDFLEKELKENSEQFFRRYLMESFDFARLQNAFQEHLADYVKTDRSGKMKYKTRLEEICGKIKECKAVADKFGRKLQEFFILEGEERKNKLNERTEAAQLHFAKILKESRMQLTTILSEAGKEKRMKEFLEEISELERILSKQLQQLSKAIAMVKSYTGNGEFTRENIHAKEENKEHAEILKSVMQDVKKKKGKYTRNSADSDVQQGERKSDKPKKGDTFKTTFEMHLRGKSIEDIALERSLTAGTIASHLAKYVEKGKLKACEFVPDDKIEKIRTVSKELDTTHYGPIKNALGEDYSYADIRFVMAEMLAGK